jgi:hypothetical protein
VREPVFRASGLNFYMKNRKNIENQKFGSHRFFSTFMHDFFNTSKNRRYLDAILLLIDVFFLISRLLLANMTSSLSHIMREIITLRFVRDDVNKAISEVIDVSLRQMQKMRCN